MQRRYVERDLALGFSHISRQKEQKSCLQSVPEAKENVGAPGTTSECRVTCYRGKRRSIKSSVFPAPIPVWRRSSRSHSTAVLVSKPGVPPRPAELIPPSAGMVPSLCRALPRKHQPQPPPGNLCHSSLSSRQGNKGQARGRAATEEHRAGTSPAGSSPKQSSHP